MTKKERGSRASGLIFEHDVSKGHGQTVVQLISSLYYVLENTVVEDLRDAFTDEDEVHILAVLDKKMNVKGVISRNKLFDILSKPFGRDLYKRKPVVDICDSVETISFTKNIFAFAESFESHTGQHGVDYFAVTDENKKFRGIFSTSDLLVYLSEITKKDLNFAQNLQSAIVKQESTFNGEGLEIIGAAKMAKGVGGDFYSARKYNEKNWIVILCDVSGKGVAASLLSVTLSGMARIYDFNDGVAPFVRAVNNYIAESFGSGMFITGIFADLNEETGEITLFDMGHSYTYRCFDKKISRIESPSRNIPLGLVQNLEPESMTIELSAGELFVVISDGIEEQKNLAGEDYTISRFFDVLFNVMDKCASVVRKKIFSSIKDFRKGQPQQDDMTFVIIKKK